MNRNIYKSNIQLFEKSFPGISEIIENCRNSIEKETEVYFEQADRKSTRLNSSHSV